MIYPFARPFQDKIVIEYKDGVVVKVHGNSLDAEVVRDMLVGVTRQRLVNADWLPLHACRGACRRYTGRAGMDIIMTAW